MNRLERMARKRKFRFLYLIIAPGVERSMENEFIESWINGNQTYCLYQLLYLPADDADRCARALIDYVLETDSANLEIKRLVLPSIDQARQ